MRNENKNVAFKVIRLCEMEKPMTSYIKLNKIAFLLSCVLITTSVASYFFNKKIIETKIYEVYEFIRYNFINEFTTNWMNVHKVSLN